MEANRLIFYIDGASHGNPGEAGVGIVMCDADGRPIETRRKYIGTATNNVAEYCALVIALQEAVKVRVKSVLIYSDSELLVRQVCGIYRVKDDKLRQLFALVENLREYFRSFEIEYIDREKNKEADKLAAQSIREKK